MMAFEFIWDFYMQIVNTLTVALGPAAEYPYSAITIVVITIGMSSISALATRAVVDVHKMRRRMTEVREWQSAYTKAVRAKDQKTVDRLKKKEQAIKNASAEMQKDNMKPLLITLIPFMLFYYIFWGVFGFNSTMVAYSPIPALPFIGSVFVFWTWYFVASFATSSLVQRLFNMPTVSD
jgi:uncharacterized membrane protein (DUF106 family)